MSPAAGRRRRKPGDFPAERLEPPRDLEKGEGVPRGIQAAVKKGLRTAKRPKKG